MKIQNIVIWFIRCCFICNLFIPTTGFSEDTKLVSFKIQDQFKRDYTETGWQDSVLIFFGCDAGGRGYNSTWSNAIKDSLQISPTELAIKRIGLADLRSVPFFLKSFIRKQFTDEQNKLILMDWDGIFPKTYNFANDECNILIFNLKRSLIYQTSVKELDNNKMSEILRLLRGQNNSIENY